MEHPITPPTELVEEWFMDQRGLSEASRQHITTAAARWGADQELEACCEWTQSYAECGDALRLARRPKPPSLKEQALALLEVEHGLNVEDLDLLRRALEALPND